MNHSPPGSSVNVGAGPPLRALRLLHVWAVVGCSTQAVAGLRRQGQAPQPAVETCEHAKPLLDPHRHHSASGARPAQPGEAAGRVWGPHGNLGVGRGVQEGARGLGELLNSGRKVGARGKEAHGVGGPLLPPAADIRRRVGQHNLSGHRSGRYLHPSGLLQSG